MAKVNKISKKYLDYKLCKVPFVQDLNAFIYNIHKKLFKGITNVIKIVCSNFKICNLNKNIKFLKREKSKILIFNQPKIRYVADLMNVLSELSSGS